MELEGGRGQDEEWFRVSVSLARYFPGADERARCYMAASRGRRVKWLARRVRRTFALRGRVALTARGHLLPPGEPLALLTADDEIQVIPATGFVEDITRRLAPCTPRTAPLTPSPRPPNDDTSPPPLLAPHDADPSLEEMKRRALRLLDNQSDRTRRRQVASDTSPSPPAEYRSQLEPTEHQVIREPFLEENNRATTTSGFDRCGSTPVEATHHRAPIPDSRVLLELAAPRRRRRVRRRRRAPPSPPPPQRGADRVDTGAALPDTQSDVTDDDEPKAGEEASRSKESARLALGPGDSDTRAEVIRNEGGERRAPRRVVAALDAAAAAASTSTNPPPPQIGGYAEFLNNVMHVM